MVEETDWIGGQMTAAAVSTMDEGGFNTDAGIYFEFFSRVIAYYASLSRDAEVVGIGGSGRGVEAHAAQALLREMIAAEPATDALYRPVLDVLESKAAALRAIRASYSDQSNIWPAKGHDVALLAAYFGDANLALESFAEEARQSTVRYWALWYPLLSEVRQLPGFKKLMTELNLVDYWRAFGWADACKPLGDADFECV